MPRRGASKRRLQNCDEEHEKTVNDEITKQKKRRTSAVPTGRRSRSKGVDTPHEKEPSATAKQELAKADSVCTVFQITGVTTKTIEESPSPVSSDETRAKNLSDSSNASDRLAADWFDRPCIELAKRLLGTNLVRIGKSGERLSGRIVETEAYLGGEDKAAHSYRGKRTERNKAMFMSAGTSYVYNIYGIYTCINISSKEEGAAVLIRSLEPRDGEELMRDARSVKRSDRGKGLKRHQLCNGPSKLTQALGITKSNGDQVDLTTCRYLWLENGDDVDDHEIVSASRIGINYAEEWTTKPLRFYVRGCTSVSVKDKNAEKNCPNDDI